MNSKLKWNMNINTNSDYCSLQFKIQQAAQFGSTFQHNSIRYSVNFLQNHSTKNLNINFTATRFWSELQTRAKQFNDIENKHKWAHWLWNIQFRKWKVKTLESWTKSSSKRNQSVRCMYTKFCITNIWFAFRKI